MHALRCQLLPGVKTRAARIRAMPSSREKGKTSGGTAGLVAFWCVTAVASRNDVIIHVAWNVGFVG